MAGPAETTLRLTLPDQAATERLGADLAALLRPGDVVAIAGDLGAGKSTLARAIVRTLAADPDLDVPSPTFTLLQSYDTRLGPVVHADLYRLEEPGELVEIGWDDLGGGDPVVLIEWPERAGDSLPAERFQVTLGPSPGDGEGREAAIEGFGAAAPRLARAAALWRFLDEAGWGSAVRAHVQGDASTRRYERLAQAGASAILMDAPRRPDGPPVQGGKPYSAIAHLAEDVRPFVALAQGLAERGFSAPAILAADLADGFLLLEDLGSQGVLRVGAPAIERMTVAVDTLLRLHGLDLPDELAVDDGSIHRLAPYDEEPMLIELELLLDWYVPTRGRRLPASERSEFLDLWRAALAPVWAARRTWTLRDYHSPNLMWLPERDGIARIGLLDFQDALMGHPAYDLVSLLQDARVDIPEALELHLLSRYVGGRQMSDVTFEPADFAMAYAALGAQRASKILGIFVRLAERDGKPAYLRHLPRVYSYLMRDLAHPALAALGDWYARHVAPPPADG
ncbi:MAG TPA: tRNA (adenosine(37)-N6)-threonylcarbamoyltransferase complex ATPase subunit type 1 TsaE [Hyphomicrobiales bacterium]|nr:tRNA (adenosine(37)-N6)-threonylcarbamoyltransferase complex ATPase subunit type 1 TsaE [Hyphomicrobiales bacterium]